MDKAWVYRWRVAWALGLWTLLLPVGAAFAQTVSSDAAAVGVVHLSARAQQRVPHDWLAVTVAARQQGADPAAVQAQLARVLDGALAQVRPLQCPGQLEASSAGVQVQPRYGREGQIVGWQGSAELLLQGRDMGQVASVAAQLPGLVITGLQLSLSRDTIARAEAALREQAIAAFRQQALEVARAFGYAGYALGEVHVSAASPDGGPPRPLLRAQAMAAAEAAPVLTVEPGQTTLEVTVSGSIRLTARP